MLALCDKEPAAAVERKRERERERESDSFNLVCIIMKRAAG